MAESQQSSGISEIRSQADAIIASGVLGRSRFYRALLEYLVTSAGRGHTPKEIEIAAAVFQRGERFDPSQDSMVRVYVHNLRQKLRQYYRKAGDRQPRCLTIPKGEYRIVVVDRDSQVDGDSGDMPRAGRPRRAAAVAVGAVLVAVGVAVGLLLAHVLFSTEHPVIRQFEQVAASPFWARMLDDDRPIVIVVGDYYIFGELGKDGNVDRLVREFAINSPADLGNQMIFDPAMASRYIDLDLTYLPSSTATALREFLRVVYTTDKMVRVVAMSDLDAMDIRDDHIIYVGYLSGLDKLIDFVFTASELAIGSTFDELINTVTGESFHSEAGIPTEQRNYRDYGLVSMFPGPNGNEFMVLAGTRDEGLMHSALAVSDPGYVATSMAAVAEDLGEIPAAYEILYEVAGFGRANLDASIVHVARLRHEAIWTGELTLPE